MASGRAFCPVASGAVAGGGRQWPAGVVSFEREIWRLGTFRAETSVGWLPMPRGDVAHPGILHMDYRWAPVPAFEMGASRLSLFGGEGRPPPKIGQLLIPTDPHVYDDPNQLEPDQYLFDAMAWHHLPILRL